MSGSPLVYFCVKRLVCEVQKIDKLYHRIVGNPYTYIDAPELLTHRELFEGMEELSAKLDQCAILPIYDVIFTIKDAKQIRKRYEKMVKIVEGGSIASAYQYSGPVDETEQKAQVMRITMRQIIAEHRELKDLYEVDDYIVSDDAVLHHQDVYTRVYEYISERMICSFRDDLVLPNPEGHSPEELLKEVHMVIVPQGSLPFIRFLGAFDRYSIRPV